MLHNLEEIITVEKWIQKIYPRVSGRTLLFIQEELEKYKYNTTAKFAVIVFSVASKLILIAVITDHYYLFLGVNFLFAINIFTHPLQALNLRCYTPGILTSLLLIIPYYSLFFYHFYHTDMLTLNLIVGAIIVMVFLIPVFLISHKTSEKVGLTFNFSPNCGK